MTSSAKRGLIAFPNSQLIISPQLFKLSPSYITPNNSGMLNYVRGILELSFKVVPNSQVQLQVSKYVLLGSAIRPFSYHCSQI